MHPLMMEEMAAERSRDAHEHARRARLVPRGDKRRLIAGRVGWWLVRAGVRMAAGPEDRVIVAIGGGGQGARRTIRFDQGWRWGRIRG